MEQGTEDITKIPFVDISTTFIFFARLNKNIQCCSSNSLDQIHYSHICKRKTTPTKLTVNPTGKNLFPRLLEHYLSCAENLGTEALSRITITNLFNFFQPAVNTIK
jgi:hypothetical protein